MSSSGGGGGGHCGFQWRLAGDHRDGSEFRNGVLSWEEMDGWFLKERKLLQVFL